MFDYRYHAISLAAVLLALAIGLLLGIAIGDQGLVSRAEETVRGNLRERVSEARSEVRERDASIELRDDFEEQTLPLLVADRLSNRRVAVVLLHGPSTRNFAEIRSVVAEAGGDVSSVSELSLPLDLEELQGAVGSTRYGTLATDPELLEPFGRRIGEQLITGGRLLRAVSSGLFESSSGTMEGADAVVLVREAPADASGSNQATRQSELEDAFVDGLVAGIGAVEAPVMGVEMTETEPSQIDWYEARGIGSVDSIDLPSGRAALVLALAGSAEGAYGVKGTRDALLPETVAAEP